jgi:hypothetical protein
MVKPRPIWIRSSFCSDSACVEVALIESDVAMRDSKNIDQPFLCFPKAEWNAFVNEIAASEYRSQ